jgi:hypothetical protein
MQVMAVRGLLVELSMSNITLLNAVTHPRSLAPIFGILVFYVTQVRPSGFVMSWIVGIT